MHAKPTEPSSEPEIKGKLNTSDDIFEILVGQHGEAQKMFARFSEISPDDCGDVRAPRKAGRKLAIEVVSRNEAESQTLYKRLMEFENLCNQVEDGRRRHKKMNAQVLWLLNVHAEDDEWWEEFRELGKAVEAHAADEESRLFPRAKKLLDGYETKRLAGEFTYLQDLRKNLMQPV